MSRPLPHLPRWPATAPDADAARRVDPDALERRIRVEPPPACGEAPVAAGGEGDA